MIIRIVKMGFIPEQIEAFLKNFEQHKDQIRNFEGCTHLQLLRDEHQNHQFLLIVIGNQKYTSITIETLRYSKRFGQIPKINLVRGPKPGVQNKYSFVTTLVWPITT